MESNKENINFEEKNRNAALKQRKGPRFNKQEDTPAIETSQTREPLKTLSHLNIENGLAGPSQGCKVLDTRRVTRRNCDAQLDWNFDVFKDIKDIKTNSKATTSTNVVSKTARENQLGSEKCLNVKTPTLLPITPTATEITDTKRVKRSLKRRSNSKLVVAAPVSAKAYHCSISSCSDIQLNWPIQPELKSLKRSYILDNLNYLLDIEERLPREPNIRKASRSCVLNWLINVNGSNNSPAVVQLTSWYLDSYMNDMWVSVEKLQVIAAACFWIATKILGYKISSTQLVKFSGHAFIEKELVFAERIVLHKLQFRVMPVVPHDFVPYLSWYCEQNSTGRLVETAAIFLCQCGVLVNRNLYSEYPSVVAAAAVKNALILLRENVLIDKLKACSIYKLAAKKTDDLNRTCTQLREAVRVVSSIGYEYKAPLFKFASPPYYISNKIVRAVNYKDILSLDTNNN